MCHSRLKPSKSSDHVQLEKLYRAGKVVLTPCKNLPYHRSISYDDRMIMEMAKGLDAAIISNDNYSDLLRENEGEYRILFGYDLPSSNANKLVNNFYKI